MPFVLGLKYIYVNVHAQRQLGIFGFGLDSHWALGKARTCDSGYDTAVEIRVCTGRAPGKATRRRGKRSGPRGPARTAGGRPG